MNYRFLSTLTLAICMYSYSSAKADNIATVVQQPKAAPSVLKVGYVDSTYVQEHLPEYQKISAELTSFEKQLSNQLEAKFKEYNEKVEAYQQVEASLTEDQKKQKAAEIHTLQSVVQDLQVQKHPKLVKKYTELMIPFQERMQKVIAEIAEAHAYTFVLNKSGADTIVFFAQEAFNLSELVLEKLKTMAHKEEVKVPVVGPKDKVTAKAKPPSKAATVVKKK